MGANTISTGSKLLDDLLKGGYEKDTITTVFGPAGSGKTNLCIIGMTEQAKNGKKVIYIDSEGGFSVSRLKQITDSPSEILENVIFLRPTNFEEQKRVFEKLKGAIDEKVGLIVFDSLSMLYRLEMGKNEDIPSVNRELSKQISALNEIARKNNVPVLTTSQVYSDFDNRDKVNIVGGDIIKYGSKCLIELQKLHKNKRKAILKKHRSLPEGEGEIFEICDKGIQAVQQ